MPNWDAVPISSTLGISVTGPVTDAELRASAVPVDGSSITQPASGTFWQETQPVSGTFWQATQPVSGTFWQATQPVSVSSIATGTNNIGDVDVLTIAAGDNNIGNVDLASKLDATNDEVATGASAGQDGGELPFTYLATGSGMDATVIKAEAGRLYGGVALNLDATALGFLKIYDKATAPDPSADSALLKLQIFLPPATGGVYTYVKWSTTHGYAFPNGIGFVLTTGSGTDETSVGAADVSLNLGYK